MAHGFSRYREMRREFVLIGTDALLLHAVLGRMQNAVLCPGSSLTPKKRNGKDYLDEEKEAQEARR